MIKTITAAPVERDSHGFWTHPDFFEPANGNEFGVEGEFDAWKASNRVVGKLEWMECEENAEELQAAYDTGDCNLNIWQPKPPAGDGWFMGSIHDTEDGPVCYWLRPIECDPKALAAHFDNCYADAFKTEHLVAERDAALNTCTLIAEALGITGAVAGDTIAQIQRLVGENAALKAFIADDCWVPDHEHPDLSFDCYHDAVELMPKTPTTDQALNEYIARSIVVPDGYQLCFVPLEQTTAFRDACTTAYEESLSGTGPCGVFMAGYRSMLSAAPKFAASLRGGE
ncbi:hypothetical protein [Yersinia aleksiciae]|uniref:hypothetical protein n=1 Tax=Yersinia aleksiciae TaxID=263819 RepID=UPI0021BD894D|nr:hypothetical protein [Yersinia aleksiciae]